MHIDLWKSSFWGLLWIKMSFLYISLCNSHNSILYSLVTKLISYISLFNTKLLSRHSLWYIQGTNSLHRYYLIRAPSLARKYYDFSHYGGWKYSGVNTEIDNMWIRQTRHEFPVPLHEIIVLRMSEDLIYNAITFVAVISFDYIGAHYLSLLLSSKCLLIFKTFQYLNLEIFYLLKNLWVILLRIVTFYLLYLNRNHDFTIDRKVEFHTLHNS